MAAFTDTHAHLDDDQLASHLSEVVDRARGEGVTRIVTVATSASSTKATMALASGQPGLFPTAGIHPNHAAGAAPTDWDTIVHCAEQPEVVGIGETGLDRHWHDTPFEMQEDYFIRHLQLSRRLQKPIIIHCREADADMLRVLRDDFDHHGPILGVMHSFVGDTAMAEACRAMGLFLSFAGMLTYKNAAALRETAAKQPLDHLLVETDSPYLTPVPMRGKRNEPAFVRHTAACLAGLLGVSVEVLAEQSTRNASRCSSWGEGGGMRGAASPRSQAPPGNALPGRLRLLSAQCARPAVSTVREAEPRRHGVPRRSLGTRTSPSYFFSNRLICDVAERHRVVVAGEAEVAGGAVLAGMRPDCP